MPVPDLLTTKLHDRKHRYLTARDALRALPGKLEADIETVRQNDELPEEVKETRIKKLRADAARKWPVLRDEAAKALEEAEDLIRRSRTSYRVDANAQARVRQLMGERGLTPGAVLEQARGLQDAATIAALRAELLYWGNENGFADAGDLIAACEQALGELEVGDYAEQAELAVEMRGFVEQLEPVARFAMIATEGERPEAVPKARMEMAHALGDDGREGRHQDNPTYQDSSQ